MDVNERRHLFGVEQGVSLRRRLPQPRTDNEEEVGGADARDEGARGTNPQLADPVAIVIGKRSLRRKLDATGSPLSTAKRTMFRLAGSLQPLPPRSITGRSASPSIRCSRSISGAFGGAPTT